MLLRMPNVWAKVEAGKKKQLERAARGELTVDAVLFANVGDDSEDPLTTA